VTSRTAIVGLLAVLFTTAPSFSQDAARGSIQGVVMDQDGKPVPGAGVIGYPEENMVKHFDATTDAQGKFTFNDLPAGFVYLQSAKPSDGYPDAFFALFKNREVFPKINVVAGEVARNVVIRLGARAAYLTIEFNDENGKLLEHAERGQLMFTRDDLGEDGTLQQGPGLPTTSILVPSVPFRLSVEIEGYQSWHYAGRDWRGKGGLISLKPGESLKLRAQLGRVKEIPAPEIKDERSYDPSLVSFVNQLSENDGCDPTLPQAGRCWIPTGPLLNAR
jgi:Carboxypeptidase regulatory-like domain